MIKFALKNAFKSYNENDWILANKNDGIILELREGKVQKIGKYISTYPQIFEEKQLLEKFQRLANIADAGGMENQLYWIVLGSISKKKPASFAIWSKWVKYCQKKLLEICKKEKLDYLEKLTVEKPGMYWRSFCSSIESAKET